MKRKLEETLEHHWKGLPLVDATEPLRMTLTVEDIASATRENPGCCALANCCSRSFGSRKVAFYRTKAFVELVDEDGNPRVERFDIDKRARAVIANFDAGKVVNAGMVKLLPPRPSERLGARSNAKKSLRERKATEAAKQGIPAMKPRKKKRRNGWRNLVAAFVRSGTGRAGITKGSAVGKPPAA
jgi:hypothetical protein